MDEKIKLLVSTFGDHRVKLDEPLTFHTLSQLHTKAKAFFIATNRQELTEILEIAERLKIPFWVIGSGTKFNFSAAEIPGLVVKNRADLLKIGAVKGKVGQSGIGVEEAAVEVDSGVSLGKLNEFLNTQNLQTIGSGSLPQSSVGGLIWTDFAIQFFVQSVIVWKNGEVEEIEVRQLDKNSQVVLTVVLKMKAKV
jgi:UDP-N-acetylenolpyruvoylglucosamine reductase